MAKFLPDSPVAYHAGKLARKVRKAPARAKREQVQREFALGFLLKMEATTRRWADAVNKKETK
jgi:hypothetical protein